MNTSSLPQTTIQGGVVLIIVGVLGYVLSGSASVTALIPALFGLLFLLLGLLGRKENLRKHAMHGMAVVALLGVLGTLRVIPALIGLFSGTDSASLLAVVSQVITLLICLGLLVLAIRSFIDARRSRT